MLETQEYFSPGDIHVNCTHFMRDVFPLTYFILVDMLNDLIIFPWTHISVYFYKWIAYSF